MASTVSGGDSVSFSAGIIRSRQCWPANGEIYYSNLSDFMFQVVFVATAMSIVSGAVAERMKLWSFLIFTAVLTGVIYPIQGYWSWGEGFSRRCWIQ